MIFTHNLDPVLLDLGVLEIRWYGIGYAISFLLGYLWLQQLARKKIISLSIKQVEDLIFGIIFALIIGARIGYFLFYRLDALFSLELFRVWHGGMSFHGGLIGVLLAIFYFSHKWRRNFLELTDVIVAPAAFGLFFGRIGNFINGELYGRPTDGSWGVIFPAGGETPRYPSQLFEAAKNLIIAGILFLTFQRKPKTGVLSFLFMALYGAGRISVEFLWRESLDGLILGMPKGAFYSIPVLFVGLAGLLWLRFRSEKRG